MSRDAFNWFEHLRAAAAHSPQALDFAYKALLKAAKEGGSSAQCEANRYALGAYDLVVNHRLPFFVSLHEHENELKEKMETTVEVISRMCPGWRIMPGWSRVDFDRHIQEPEDETEWGPRLVGQDGKIRTDVLFQRLDQIGTVGGGPYRQLLAFVNADVATYAKMVFSYVRVEDYRDLLENASK